MNATATRIPFASIAGVTVGTPSSLGEVVMVNPTELHEGGQGTLRVDSPDLRNSIRAIKDSIKTHGYDPESVLTGAVEEVDGQRVIAIHNGYSRLAALRQLAAEGVDLPSIPVEVPGGLRYNAKVTIDGELQLVSKEPSFAHVTPRRPADECLDTFESASVCRRLIEQGMSKNIVAQRTGLSIGTVNRHLKLMSLSEEIRELVRNGSLSATAALRTFGK